MSTGHRNSPLAVDARNRRGVVDERDGVERRTEEHDLAGALDNAGIRGSGAVRVVQRVGKRDGGGASATRLWSRRARPIAGS
jgi:hypothetical protein